MMMLSYMITKKNVFSAQNVNENNEKIEEEKQYISNLIHI